MRVSKRSKAHPRKSMGKDTKKDVMSMGRMVTREAYVAREIAQPATTLQERIARNRAILAGEATRER